MIPDVSVRTPNHLGFFIILYKPQQKATFNTIKPSQTFCFHSNYKSFSTINLCSHQQFGYCQRSRLPGYVFINATRVTTSSFCLWLLTASSRLPLSLTLYVHNNGRILSCKNYQTIRFVKLKKFTGRYSPCYLTRFLVLKEYKKSKENIYSNLY